MTGVNYVPKRFQGRVGYQIFVDRFFREGLKPEPIAERRIKNWTDSIPDWKPDDDGEYRNEYYYTGNLNGITAKLDYIKKLGFDLIYLSPISYTHTSHHYDVSNQTQIDPWIGTKEDFKQLCKEAHKRDILICVDLVFNHMGYKSEKFQAAMSNEKSEYHCWFEWDELQQPVYWCGFKDMPQCNKIEVAYQEDCYQVCETYINWGADGIRLDLGEILPKVFLIKLRERVKKLNPEVLIISEMWEIATFKENPQIYGDQVDSVMNYPMSDAICRWVRYGNYKHFDYTFAEISKYPDCVQNVVWNVLDTHDTPRLANMLVCQGMNENPFTGRIWDIEAPWRYMETSTQKFDTFGFRKWEMENDCVLQENVHNLLRLASLLQYFVRGIPITFYGTEAGLTGYKDPFNRKPYPWANQDQFLLTHYTGLGYFKRTNNDILSEGVQTIRMITERALLLAREAKHGTLFLVMNRTDVWQSNPINELGIKEGQKVYEINEVNSKSMSPFSAAVYRTTTVN